MELNLISLKAKVLSLSLMALATAFTSCDDEDDEPDVPSDAYIDFVTVASNSDSGSSFTISKAESDEIATLTTTSRIAEGFTVGSRALIQYTAEQSQYESGKIKLYGINSVINGEVKAGTAATTENWSSDPLTMLSCYRTGKYINISGFANMTSTPRKFEIVADEATLSDDYPTAYVLYLGDNAMAQQLPLYASIDLSPVWGLETAKGIKLVFHTSSGVNDMVFEKNISQTVKPAE